jgi:hypothetical protein
MTLLPEELLKNYHILGRPPEISILAGAFLYLRRPKQFPILWIGRFIPMINSKWLLAIALLVSMIGFDAVAAEKPGAYKISGSAGKEIVADQGSGLTWQKAFELKLNWTQATDHCGSLGLGGKNDWRLPTRKELMTIVKYRLNNPASDFPGMPGVYFWSATTSSESEGFAWGINFRNGSLNNYDKASTQHARCVRGE